jgi:hypothetical protein
MQIIPLDNSPNQKFQATLSVNGANITFSFFISYNEVAGYWLMRITDPKTGIVILDSIPLVTITRNPEDANLLTQYSYMKIGCAYLVKVAPTDSDYPDSTNLGTIFQLLWGDNLVYYDTASVGEVISIIESLSAKGNLYSIIQLAGADGKIGVMGPGGIQGPSGSIPIVYAVGTADAITADYTPDLALIDKMLCAFVATGANTLTTPTFAPDGLTPCVITKKGGLPLVAGDIPGAGAICIVVYNLTETRWELVNPASVMLEASVADINGGTNTGKYVSSDKLAGSNLGTRIIEVIAVNFTSNCSIGNGKAYVRIPEELSGMNLVRVAAACITAGVTGTMSIQIVNITDSENMLSVELTIDSGETDSKDAATPSVIDEDHDDVVTGDILRIDITAIHTGTAAKGLIVELGFRLP